MLNYFPDTYFISSVKVTELSRTTKFILCPIEGLPCEEGEKLEIERIRNKYKIEDEYEVKYYPAIFEIIQKTNDPKNI